MASCTCANPNAIVEQLKEQNDILKDFHETYYGKDMQNDTQGGDLHGGSLTVPSDATFSSPADAALHDAQVAADAGGKPRLGAAPTRFATWAAPEVSNEGESAWSWIWRTAGLALALYNTKIQGKIYKEQERLSNNYYNMAKDKLNRFMNNYKPLELALLEEVKTEPEAEMNCKDDRKRAKASVNGAFDTLGGYLERQAKKLRVCIDDSKTHRMDYRKTLALVDAENYNLIDDQLYVDYKNDRRWNRRSNVLSLGRNMSGEALNFGDVARTFYGQLGPQLDKITGSLMGAIGYYGGRNDTYYPNMFLGNYGGLGNSLISTGTTAGQWQPQQLAAGV